jgi:toxoflavin biosynthesis protein ToxC
MKLGPYETAVKSVAWSGDSLHMAVGAYDRTVRVWDLASGQECMRWHGPHFWPRSLDWSSDGKAILVGTVAAEPALLTVPELKPSDDPQTVTVPPGSVTRGVNHLAGAGPLLVSGTDDGQVSIWRSSAFAFGAAVGDGALVNAVSIAPTESQPVAYGTFGGQVGVLGWRSPEAEAATTIQGLHPINRVVWSPDGAHLATADYEGLLRIYLWDGMSLKERATYSGHSGAIKDVCWIADERLVTISTDRTAHLVSADGKRLREFTGHGELVNAGSATTVAGTTVLATASRDRTIRVYDLESAALLNVLVGHDESVKAVAWKPGSPVLLSGSYDFDAKVWHLDPHTWQLASVETLSAHTNAVSCVTWYGDDPVTGGWDGRILVWQAGGNGARLEARELHRAAAVRPRAGDRD